jgi:peptidyl-tRNA hydrolase
MRAERLEHKILVQEWERRPDRRVVTLKIKDLKQLEDLVSDAVLTDINHYVQVDLGLTQTVPNTKTVLALGPDYSGKLDNLTKGLKLY